MAGAAAVAFVVRHGSCTTAALCVTASSSHGCQFLLARCAGSWSFLRRVCRSSRSWIASACSNILWCHSRFRFRARGAGLLRWSWSRWHCDCSDGGNGVGRPSLQPNLLLLLRGVRLLHQSQLRLLSLLRGEHHLELVCRDGRRGHHWATTAASDATARQSAIHHRVSRGRAATLWLYRCSHHCAADPTTGQSGVH